MRRYVAASSASPRAMDGSPFSMVDQPLKMKGDENHAFRRPLAEKARDGFFSIPAPLMRRVLPLLILGIALAWAPPAGAHPVAVSASVSPDAIEMAGTVTYTVFAEWPDGWNVTPPRLSGATESFEVVGCDAPKITQQTGGNHEMAVTCRLVAFDSGRVQLPEVPLQLTGPDGQTDVVTAPILSVDVIAPLVDETARPYKSQETIHRDWLKIIAYALAGALTGALLLAALFFGIRWLVRKITGRGREEKKAPPEPADHRALRRLAGEPLGVLLDGGEPKPYYSELTDIAREYLEGRFGVPALEQTTTETMRAVVGVELGDYRDFLGDLLTVADLAKFAGSSVNRPRWEDDRDKLRRLVVDTRLAIVDAPPEEAA